ILSSFLVLARRAAARVGVLRVLEFRLSERTVAFEFNLGVPGRAEPEDLFADLRIDRHGIRRRFDFLRYRMDGENALLVSRGHGSTSRIGVRVSAVRGRVRFLP